MVITTRILCSAIAAAASAVLACSSALALPALQLGPGSGGWVYDSSTQTWVTSGPNIDLNAFANDTMANGGNGSYAWDSLGAPQQRAYLVISAVPQVSTDAFDITVTNDGIALGIINQGYGTPPLNDPNSLAPHGIFDTWFEVYEFKFNGTATTISDQQPGGTGNGQGFTENFDITVNSVTNGATGLHFDLFTVEGDKWRPNNPNDKDLVYAFAPFSHDAEAHKVSEPAPFAVLGLGLAVMGWLRRRKSAT